MVTVAQLVTCLLSQTGREHRFELFFINHSFEFCWVTVAQLVTCLLSQTGREHRFELFFINHSFEFCWVTVAQLVRASVCGTEGRGFKSLQSPSRT